MPSCYKLLEILDEMLQKSTKEYFQVHEMLDPQFFLDHMRLLGAPHFFLLIRLEIFLM